ncbi:hypothetical protein LR48_Vigan05g111900 [Vigna angularis]|uniref:Uncharacterized protein n=1 Tax=Phaseolus angularis TaxID=3914 RepID=A0A0L9UKW9_PHAAN|nr:hypothetical protein LR48_Vigan05g111900 [Vigna angularis]
MAPPINKKKTTMLPAHEIRDNTLRQIGFVKRGNTFVHKEDAKNDDDDDAHMTESVNVVGSSNVGPSHDPSLSSFSIEDQFATVTQQIEQMSTLQQSKHEELMKLQHTHHEHVCEL